MEKKFIKLLQNDVLYDGRSIIFYKGSITEIIDENDGIQLLEGRLGEFPIERIETKMGILLYIPLTKTSHVLFETEDITDEEDKYQIVTKTRFLCVKKIAFKKSNAQMEFYKENKDFVCNVKNKDVLEYMGLLKTGQYGKMLGFVSFIEGKDEVYILKYAGEGNFTDVRIEQEIILKFMRKRVERWKKELL